MAAGGAGKPTASSQQQQQELFAAKHRELAAEAADVARDFGVNVTTVAFLPDAGAGAPRAAVSREFRGGGGDAVEAIRRAVARDVSEMGLAEATAHEARLRALRAAVASKLEEKKKLAAAAATTAAACAADGGEVIKREPEQQQQEALAGGKIMGMD